MAAGDTFRAAASDQLEIWAERTNSEIVVAEGENVKAQSGKLFNKLRNMNLFPSFSNLFASWLLSLVRRLFICSMKLHKYTDSSFSTFAIFHLQSDAHVFLVLSQAVKRGKEGGYDVILCDTSGRMYICVYIDHSFF